MPPQATYGEPLTNVESDRYITTLNAMSAGRAVGGAVLGVGMATGAVGPEAAVIATVGLAATDAEGSLYVATQRFPRMQKALGIIPSRWGRMLDPIADKIFVASVFLGGMAGGLIDPYDGVPILATEAATTAATGYVRHKNGEYPEVSKAGKASMVARCGSVLLNLCAAASEDQLYQESLQWAAHGMTAGAAILGMLSIKNILAQRKNKTS